MVQVCPLTPRHRASDSPSPPSNAFGLRAGLVAALAVTAAAIAPVAAAEAGYTVAAGTAAYAYPGCHGLTGSLPAVPRLAAVTLDVEHDGQRGTLTYAGECGSETREYAYCDAGGGVWCFDYEHPRAFTVRLDASGSFTHQVMRWDGHRLVLEFALEGRLYAASASTADAEECADGTPSGFTGPAGGFVSDHADGAGFASAETKYYANDQTAATLDWIKDAGWDPAGATLAYAFASTRNLGDYSKDLSVWAPGAATSLAFDAGGLALGVTHAGASVATCAAPV